MSLDTLQNRWEKEATANAAYAAEAILNPSFPFTVVAFDPAAFGLNLDPEIDSTDGAST